MENVGNKMSKLIFLSKVILFKLNRIAMMIIQLIYPKLECQTTKQEYNKKKSWAKLLTRIEKAKLIYVNKIDLCRQRLNLL